jgi:hypothetical protein
MKTGDDNDEIVQSFKRVLSSFDKKDLFVKRLKEKGIYKENSIF